MGDGMGDGIAEAMASLSWGLNHFRSG
jgi:hypothetical protein